MYSKASSNEERFKRQIRGAHKKFIHQMYSEFGLAKELKLCISFEGSDSIGLKEEFDRVSEGYFQWLMRFPSLTYQVEIHIPQMDDLKEEDLMEKINDNGYICFHETAHHLHMIKNWQFFLDKREANKNNHWYILDHKNPGTRFTELVAELGVLIFLNKNGGFEEYLNQMKKDNYLPALAGYNAFKKGLNLERLASKTFKDGLSVIDNLWPNDLKIDSI